MATLFNSFAHGPPLFSLQNNFVQNLQPVLVEFVVLLDGIELNTGGPQEVLQFFHARVNRLDLGMSNDPAFFGDLLLTGFRQEKIIEKSR